MTTTSIDTTTSNNDHTANTLSECEKKMLRDPPYKLSLSMDELLAPAKRTRKNKKDSNNPRQQNKWIIFRKDYEAKLRLLNPNATYKIQDISKEYGAEWRSQPSEVNKYFDLLQRIAFEKHKLAYPNYKYSPKKKESVFREDNNELYEDDEDDECEENNNSNNNCVVSDSSSINVSSNSTTMNSSAESSTIFEFNLPQRSQYTPIGALFSKQLDFHSNECMPSATASPLTQHPISIPENFDTSAAPLSSFSFSNELNSEYNNLVYGLGNITTNNNELIPSISPNYTINNDAGTAIDTFNVNEINSLGQLDFSQTNRNNNQITIFNEFDSDNPLNFAENNYLSTETNNFDVAPIYELLEADPKESFGFNSNYDINNNDPILISSPQNPFTIITNPLIFSNTLLISPSSLQSLFIPEYLDYDSTFLAGDLSEITSDDSQFGVFA
ncbi:12015_t:CDS:1 [Ambispora gerdemannii]|uniref:12015_t:CDS:1 n=1 Tax=Ambispora gerdemannii TaxID=144530 RepID=A0A9N9A9D7_9GLOM|nr:12015_t:CDS:1 [Ambispora gerdemannii]